MRKEIGSYKAWIKFSILDFKKTIIDTGNITIPVKKAWGTQGGGFPDCWGL